MNFYLIIAGMLVVAGATGFGYKLGVDHEVAARARENKHIEEAIKVAADVAAKAIAEIKPKYVTIHNKLQKEIQNEIVYRDCKLTPNGMQLLNEALTGAATSSGSKLPKTVTTGE